MFAHDIYYILLLRSKIQIHNNLYIRSGVSFTYHVLTFYILLGGGYWEL